MRPNPKSDLTHEPGRNPGRMPSAPTRVDRTDLLAFGGLAALGVGIGMLSVAWALIVVGGL
jgi:hypothetical protein